MRVLVPSHAERDTVTVGKASSDCMMDVLAEALHAAGHSWKYGMYYRGCDWVFILRMRCIESDMS